MPGQDLVGQPRPSAREVDHSDLAEGGRQAGVVPEPLGELDRPSIGLLGPVQVHLEGRRAERLAERALEQGLAELERRPELRGGVPALGRASLDTAGQLGGGIVVVARPERGRASELDVELDRGITHRLSERGQLGEAVEPFAGPAEDRERVVADRQERPPVARRRDDLQRLLDEPERLLGGVGGEGGRGGVDREAARTGGVAGRHRMLGEHRQPRRCRVAAVQEQIDDGGMDLPTAGRREQARGELADLFVREGVVGGLALRLLEQEAGCDGGRELVGELIVVFVQPRADRPEVPQAEASAEDRRVAERRPGRGGEPRRPAIDECADGGRQEPRGVAAEPPLPLDLLERARVAMGPRELLDDERHALRLGVHDRRGGGLDRPAEDPLQELRRLERPEPPGPQPPHEAHALHVGNEVDRLRDRRELVRTDRQEQEDRLVGVAPDDVAEEPQGVVVGPLDVVDEQRQRADPGQ